MMGASLGVLEAGLLPGTPATVWPLISMAAMLGGMMRAPFTAVVFAWELTHDQDALLPLLIASVAAYAFTVLAMKRSILTEKVARRGYDLFREYVVDPLERVRVRNVMSEHVLCIPAALPLRQVLSRYFSASHKHRGYPVLGSAGELKGVLTSSDLLHLETLEPLDGIIAADLIRGTPIVAYPQESCRVAAERMASNGVGRMPVVEPSDPKRVLGIVTRSDLLKPRLQSVEEEDRPQRILGKPR